MEVNQIKRLPLEFRQIYRKHFTTIHTRISRGRIKTVYHFMIISDLDNEAIKQYLMKVINDRNDSFKLNMALGYILRHIESGEIRFFYPSQNSTILDLPVLIENRHEFHIC